MGQAKRRGSFEQRKAEAMTKAASRAIDDAEAVRKATSENKVPVSRRVRGFVPSALAAAALALSRAPGEHKDAPK
jgi:hypothetical protein